MGKAEVKAMEEMLQLGESKATAAKEELERVKSEAADRERRIAEAHEIAGRIQAFNFVEKVVTVSSLVQLKGLKESKVYRDLPNIGTWEKYCEYLGLDRNTVDERLRQLDTFGVQFLETCHQFSVSHRELRKLRQLTHEGAVTIDAEAVVIGEETIPLDGDHTEELQTAIERIIEELKHSREEIEDQTATLKSKEAALNKLDKKVAKLTREAEKRGYTEAEEAFLKRMDNSRTILDGFLLDFDPERNPLPEDASPRMRAAYMETLGYIKRAVDASYDTASDYYGEPEMDGSGWVPPHLRDKKIDD